MKMSLASKKTYDATCFQKQDIASLFNTKVIFLCYVMTPPPQKKRRQCDLIKKNGMIAVLLVTWRHGSLIDR